MTSLPLPTFSINNYTQRVTIDLSHSGLFEEVQGSVNGVKVQNFMPITIKKKQMLSIR